MNNTVKGLLAWGVVTFLTGVFLWSVTIGVIATGLVLTGAAVANMDPPERPSKGDDT